MASKRARALRDRVLAAALAFPEAYADHPWGETVVKVNKKVFLFAGSDDGDGAGITVKLPESRDQALGLPDATPAGYGLGKAGWVSLTFTAEPPAARRTPRLARGVLPHRRAKAARPRARRDGYLRSNRARFMTLSHAATKSSMNFTSASALA